MAGIQVKVDANRAALAMAAFRLGVTQREELLRVIGEGQLLSIYKTFDESGSPAGSWPPLSPVSLRWRKYSEGHKLLMDTGQMRNSIGIQVRDNRVVIGTGLKRAAVHQFGFHGSQNVGAYSYTRHSKSRDIFSRESIINKAGRKQTVMRKVASGITQVHVNGFTRHLNIPARPFLVFRPEDPERIATEVKTYLVTRAKSVGLEAE